MLIHVANDIVNYLSSRHGIVVDVETIKQDILVQLTGELELEPAYKMDLVEMVALLLIPYLLSNTSKKAISQVLHVMLNETDSSKLSRHFLKTLLDFHGEVEVADSVLDSMMEAAGGEGAVLNFESLKHALTSDVTKFHTEWTDRMTTHYQDVFENEPASPDDTEPANQDSSISFMATRNGNNNDEEDPKLSKGKPSFQNVWTAPAIDFVADTYRSQTYSVLLWLTLVMVYLAYFWNCKFLVVVS